MGHQITAMFEWMKNTDMTLHVRLKDDVYADDVPAEAEKLIVEFNQYEAFLRSVEDKIHSLRSTGKNEAAKRLEQQLVLLRVRKNELFEVKKQKNKRFSSRFFRINFYNFKRNFVIFKNLRISNRNTRKCDKFFSKSNKIFPF